MTTLMTTEPAASMTDKRIYLIKQTERKKTQTGRFGYYPAPGVLSAAIKVDPAYQFTPPKLQHFAWRYTTNL